MARERGAAEHHRRARERGVRGRCDRRGRAPSLPGRALALPRAPGQGRGAHAALVLLGQPQLGALRRARGAGQGLQLHGRGPGEMAVRIPPPWPPPRQRGDHRRGGPSPAARLRQQGRAARHPRRAPPRRRGGCRVRRRALPRRLRRRSPPRRPQHHHACPAERRSRREGRGPPRRAADRPLLRQAQLLLRDADRAAHQSRRQGLPGPLHRAARVLRARERRPACARGRLAGAAVPHPRQLRGDAAAAAARRRHGAHRTLRLRAARRRGAGAPAALASRAQGRTRHARAEVAPRQGRRAQRGARRAPARARRRHARALPPPPHPSGGEHARLDVPARLHVAVLRRGQRGRARLAAAAPVAR